MFPEKTAEGWVERTHASGGSGRNGVPTLHVVALTQLASGTALQTRDACIYMCLLS